MNGCGCAKIDPPIYIYIHVTSPDLVRVDACPDPPLLEILGALVARHRDPT